MQSKTKATAFSQFTKRADWSKLIVYAAFIVVFIFFAIVLADRGFLTDTNLLNIIREKTMICIMAVAMTFVIAAGQIDLSVGAIAALTSVIAALIMSATNNVILGLLGGLTVGAIAGLINGLLVTLLAIPSFLVTLGTTSIISGLAMWFCNTAAIPILNKEFNFIFGSGEIAGIPILLPWTVLFLVIGVILLNYSTYGKKVLATGGNEIAARFTGINTNRIKLLVLLMNGIFASIAGIMYAGRLQAGRFNYGDSDALSVIAAVIIGGTSLAGGNGSVVGAVVGALLMGVIGKGLILGGLQIYQQNIIMGVILILAVALGNKIGKNKVR